MFIKLIYSEMSVEENNKSMALVLDITKQHSYLKEAPYAISLSDFKFH